MNIQMSRGRAVPMAEARNIAAARNMATLRPKRSESGPTTSTPVAQPTSTHADAQPFMKSDSWKCAVSGSMAPEMTPVSYPNSNPPIVATRQHSVRYIAEPFSRWSIIYGRP